MGNMKFKKVIAVATFAVMSFGVLGQTIMALTPSSMGSCGQFMEARKRDDDDSKIKAFWAVVWVWGYLSRYNAESQQAQVEIPTETGTMFLFMEKYCRNQPLAGLINISTQLIVDLGGKLSIKTPNKK